MDRSSARQLPAKVSSSAQADSEAERFYVSAQAGSAALYRDKVRYLLALAEKASSRESQEKFLEIALQYETLALHAELVAVRNRS